MARPDRVGDGAYRISRRHYWIARHRVHGRDGVAHGGCARRDQRQLRGYSQHATARLPPGLTAVAGFDKGFVQAPSRSMQLMRFLKSNSPLLIPLIAFFVMLWLWWTRGRDPQRQAISVQYEPPDKLTPGECGTLVDNEAAMRDITATLVDLAVKGY